MPLITNFSACPKTCNGSNDARVFSEAIEKIYVEYDYENIPVGAEYSRVWLMDGKEWIRYQCIWEGQTNGTDRLTLREPKGFHSGIWQMIITVDGEILLDEKLQVSGNWTYWDPAGTRNSCYD